MDEMLKWMFGGGVGVVIGAILKGYIDWRKSTAELDESSKENVVKRLNAYIDLLDREHSDDRNNLVKLHQDYVVVLVENTRLQTKAEYLEAETVSLKTEISRLKGEHGL